MSNTTLTCNCLDNLSLKLDAEPFFLDLIVTELIVLACQKKEQQQKLLIRDIHMPRYIAMGQDKVVAKMWCFLLPGSSDHLICFGTYCQLLGYGRGATLTLIHINSLLLYVSISYDCPYHCLVVVLLLLFYYWIVVFLLFQSGEKLWK